MLNWSLILHFHQPPQQDAKIVRQVIEHCYNPVISIIEQNPHQNFTINISGSLTQRLIELKETNLLGRIAQLVQLQQIELATSLFTHPILPTIDQKTIHRQISKDQEYTHFAYKNQASGIFFPPELAIIPENIELLNKHGLTSIIVDSTGINAEMLTSYALQHSTLDIYISERKITEFLRSYPIALSLNQTINFVRSFNKNNLVINANDVELFGHHYRERVHLFKELVESDDIRFLKLSNISNQHHLGLTDSPINASSWQNYPPNTNSDPFILWNDRENKNQQRYLALARLAQRQLASQEIPENDINLHMTSAFQHLDVGLSSCFLYWISNKPWWHPDLAEIGATHLVKAIRTANTVNSAKKIRAEKLFAAFIQGIWETHWKGKQFSGYKRHEKHKENLDQLLLEQTSAL